MKKIFKNPRLLIFSSGLFVVILLTVVGVWIGVKESKKTAKDPNVLAVLGDKKITKQDLNKAIYALDFLGTVNSPTNLSDKEKAEELDKLIENNIILLKAKELGLEASKEEIETNIASAHETMPDAKDGMTIYEGYTDEQKTITYENAKIEVLKAKVKEKVLAWLEGNYLMVRYDKYTKDWPDNQLIAVPSDAERDRLTKEQKEAAQVMAAALLTRLKSGEPFDTVRTSLIKDSKVGMPGVAPQTPAMTGTINKELYFEELQELAQFPVFNEEVFNVKEGDSSTFQIKDEQGKELKFFVVYQAKKKQDGFKWGYQNWLESEKKRLLNTKSVSSILLKQLEKITPKANAFANDICGTSGFGHAFCNQVGVYYMPRGSSTRQYIPNYSLHFDDLRHYAGGIIVPADPDSPMGAISRRYEWNTNTQSVGVLYQAFHPGYGNGHNYTGKYYIDCYESGYFQITANGGDPSISGAVAGYGTWGLNYSYSHPAHLEHSGNFGSRTGNPYVKVHLTGTDMDTANGKSGATYFRWYPHWNDAPNAYPTTPDNKGYSATTTAVPLYEKAWDPDSDQTSLKAQYRDITNPSSPGAWVSIPSGGTYSSLGASMVDRSFGSAAVSQGHKYEWQARAKDAHGVEGAWSHSHYFWVNSAAGDICDVVPDPDTGPFIAPYAFQYTADIPGQVGNYSWVLGGETPPSTTTGSITHTYKTPGNKEATVTRGSKTIPCPPVYIDSSRSGSHKEVAP